MKGAFVLAFLTTVQGVHRAEQMQHAGHRAEQMHHVGHKVKMDSAQGKMIMLERLEQQKLTAQRVHQAQAAVKTSMEAIKTYIEKKNAVSKHQAQLDAMAQMWDSLSMPPTEVADGKVRAYGELATKVEELKVVMEMTAQEIEKATAETTDASDKASLDDKDKSLALVAEIKESKTFAKKIVLENYKRELEELGGAREVLKATLDPELASNEDAKAAQKGFARRVEMAFVSMVTAQGEERDALGQAGDTKNEADRKVKMTVVVVPKAVIVDAVLDKEAGLQRQCEEHKGRYLLDLDTTTISVVDEDWVTYAGCIDSCQTDRKCRKAQYDNKERTCKKYNSIPMTTYDGDQHKVSLNEMERADALICEDWFFAKQRVTKEFNEAKEQVQTAASFIESFSDEIQDKREGLHRFKMASLLSKAPLSPAVEKWKSEFFDAHVKAREAKDRKNIAEAAVEATSLLDASVDLSEFVAAGEEPDSLKRSCRKFPDTRLASVGELLQTPQWFKTNEECFKTCFDLSTCEQAMFHEETKTCQLRTKQTLQKHEGTYDAAQFISLQCRFA